MKKKFNLYLLLTLVTFTFITVIGILYSTNPILDQHSFRQTQTAISAKYIFDGSIFNYQTPILGEPYNIPFEFPIYQILVAFIYKYGSFQSLTQVGRIVSLFFSLLTIIPLYKSLSILKIENDAIFLVLALFLSSPIYIFWSSAFMIESTALFFTLSFIFYGLKLFNKQYSSVNFTFYSFFLLLASLQKITTVLPVIPFSVISILYSIFPSFNKRKLILLKLGAALFTPLLISILWIKFSDAQKALNPIGVFLTSSALTSWNFGFFEQKISKELWLNIIVNRNIKENTSYYFGIITIFLSFVMLKDKRVLSLIVISSLSFIFPFLIFTNLHIVHNYYQFSNDIFLCVALGLSLYYGTYNYLKNSAIKSIIICFFIASNYFYFYLDYFPSKTKQITIKNNKTLQLAEFIRSNTPENLPIIIYGFDWSSELPFYADRKALLLPPWANFDIQAINHPEVFFKSFLPSAIVLCDKEIESNWRHKKNTYTEVQQAIKYKYPFAKYKIVSGCEIYLIN